MGWGSGACKFLGIIFIFSLLVQGSCAAEENDETNTNLNDTINDTLIGTINGTIDGTIRNTQMFSWVLLLPLFFGCLLFLGWVCRYFHKMTFCFVLFMLSLLFLLLVVILLIGFNEKNLVLLLTTLLIVLTLLYMVHNESKEKEDKDKKINNLLYKVRCINIIGAVLVWPAILVYFYRNDIQYVTFYGIEDLKFPVYIITASLIGVISYILLSIGDTFSHLISEYEKLNAVWSYLRRFLIAPFIAIVGFYLLNLIQNRPEELEDINNRFVFVFSFVVGVFTKTIEDWIYSCVQTLLPGDKKIEFESRILNDVTESDFVKKLKFDKEVAYMLYNAKIRTIEELAFCEPKQLITKLNLEIRNLGEDSSVGKSCYPLESIRMYIKMAQEYIGMDDKSELVKELKMDKDLAFKLYYFADIRNIDDLIECDPNDVFKKICDCEKEAKKIGKEEAYKKLCGYSEKEIRDFKNIAEILANSKKIDKEKAYKELCGCSEEEIKKFMEKAEKLSKEKVEPTFDTSTLDFEYFY